MKVFVHYTDGTQEEINCDGVESFSFVVKEPLVEELVAPAPVDVPIQEEPAEEEPTEVAPATEEAPVIEEEAVEEVPVDAPAPVAEAPAPVEEEPQMVKEDAPAQVEPVEETSEVEVTENNSVLDNIVASVTSEPEAEEVSPEPPEEPAQDVPVTEEPKKEEKKPEPSVEFITI